MVPEDEPPEDQEAAPLVPEPAVPEPAVPEPAEREPAGREPAEREPAERERAGRQPAEREPAERQPAGRQPAGREPAGREPAERPSSAATLPRIDGYRIEGVLGRGSTGVVYSAVQLAVDRPVALKILHANLVGTKRAVRRLQREARTAARLAHPSIITAIDMGEQDGQWWYAMELVEGISLADRIKEKGVFTEREALRFFIPLCDALQHAFEGGVVHRDIKPANILIDAHGSARLVDLGLAFAEDDPLITAPGGTLGTPHYISPEQAKDPSSADSQSDLWSLGATMYHALCGRPPFAGASVAEILSGVLYGRVPEPRKFAPQLSKGMSLVLRKCLTRDPERRYREPAQLERDLERIRERRSPHVRAANLDPVDTGRPAWVGRALAMGGVGLAVLVGTLLITRPWEERGGGSTQGGSGQTGWAELENLRQDFEAGEETHARTLETLGLLVAPEGLDTDRTDFSAKVISDLSFRVVQLTDELGVELESLCLDHDFQAARSRLDGLAQALRDRTGFIEVSALPDKARRHLQNWSGTQRELLGAARRGAVTAGNARLETYFEGTLVPGFEQLTGKHRWRDALESLEPKDAWLGGEGAGVDLRGLNAAEQQRILDSVRSARTAKIREARNAYHRLDGELANFVEDERQVLQDKIRNSTVQDASAVLGRAYRGERQARGVDPAQIPGEWLQPGGVLVGSTLKLDRAQSDLEDFEARILRERAQLLFPGNDRTASRLCLDRRYSEAAAFWAQHLEDPASVAVHPRMRMRQREARHLEALLAQAADGVRSRRGLEFLPVIDGIEFDGVILTAADVLERGFQLRPNEKNFEDLLVHLVRPDPLPKDERLLGATYVLELADLGASALDRYRSALFLFYENQLQKAAERLPHEDPEQEFSDLLDGTDGLRERIQAALARLGRDRREEQESMAVLIRRIRRGVDTGATPDRLQRYISTLFEAYGDLLDATVAKDMRALERELASKTAPPTMFESYGVSPELSRNRGVRLTWTFDREGLGSWEAGDWAVFPESLQLLSSRDGDPEFWSRERSLHLPLVSPLDLQAGFKLTLELRTNRPEAERHQLVVSALGAHAIFLEDDDHPVFLAGAGDGRDLLAEARASSARENPGVGNLPRDRPFELVLEVRPNSAGKLLVWLDGEQLRVDKQRTWKIGEKPEVRLHSMLPLELLSASIEGQRLAGTQ